MSDKDIFKLIQDVLLKIYIMTYNLPDNTHRTHTNIWNTI